LIVNVLGSFAIGVLVETMAQVWTASNEARLFLVVGLLGSFTTFSAFSLDVVTLYERRAYLAMMVYALSSFVLSIGGLTAGLALTRRMVGSAL
jgi:CrcB protein